MMIPAPALALSVYTQLRVFHSHDLPALVSFWNQSFAERRNFSQITSNEFHRRILSCPAFDVNGLILAWNRNNQGDEKLVGMIHAFRPAPEKDHYRRWERRHSIALLYVEPAYRNQGIGGRLLRAAENWLYYCPVFVGNPAQPGYGGVEGPRRPFFGSAQHMGISAGESDFIRFLAKRGYAVVDPGDVSMTLQLRRHAFPPPSAPDPALWNLRLLRISDQSPFTGVEPPGREEYTLWGHNYADIYSGLILVDDQNLLRGHISWYPMAQARHCAVATYWLAPELRGQGLGGFLLDQALHDMVHSAPPRGGAETVELYTHLAHHSKAVKLYKQRSFEVDEAWVNLVKT